MGLVAGLAVLALLLVPAAVETLDSSPHQAVVLAPQNPGLSAWLNEGGTAVSGTPSVGAVPRLPRSLQGLELPGAVGETADGRLRIDRGVRELFDHFLAATGEADCTALRLLLKAALEARLGARAVDEAMVLFDAYVAYQAGLANNRSAAPAENVEQLRARQASMRSARTRAFSPEVVRAFFGEDDRYDDYVFAKLEIMRDASAGVAQRAARLADLRAGLSEAMRNALSATELVMTLTELTDQWQAQRGTPNDLRDLREKLVGPAAADRLTALDQQTRVWDDKVAEYLQQRERMLADASLAPSQARRQVDALRSARFGSEDLLRIQTLEQIRDESSTTPRTSR